MAATFKLYCDIGGTTDNPGTPTDCSALSPNIRFKTADDNAINSSNPIPIPTSGTNRSYWKSVYLLCTGSPSSQVNNVKFYTDGTGFGTGIVTYVGIQTPTHNSGATTGYDVAIGTPASTGEEVVLGHADITTKQDAFYYVSGTPLTVSISESGSIINNINETTDYVVLQMDVGSAASPGDLADETFTFSYDEI
jgi:hypothetical protein